MQLIIRFRYPYAWLSNFSHIYLVRNGIQYPSVEHAFQAAKFDGEPKHQHLIAAMEEKPAEAKRYARRIWWPTENWKQDRFAIMRGLLRQKFSEHVHAKLLLDTKEALIIEGNTWHDNLWGICICGRCDANGQNRLGSMLMQIRSELQDGTLQVRGYVPITPQQEARFYDPPIV